MTADPDPLASLAGPVAPGQPLTGIDDTRYRQLFEHSPVAGLLVNRAGEIIEFNRRASDLLLIDPELRSHPDLPGYVSQIDQTVLAEHLDRVFSTRQRQTVAIHIRIANGEDIPAHLISQPVEDGRELCQVTLLEIGGQTRNARVLSHLAYYDQLTGLPNRLLFSDRLRWAVRDARRRKEKLAVMVIDLDHFKTVNDTMGHDAGDFLLKDLSARMLACLRDSDTLSRMGGDEFTVLIQHANGDGIIEAVAERLLEVIRQVVPIQDRPVMISGSIGICVYPEDGDSADLLVHNADIAMYRSKAGGRNRYAFFNDTMRSAVSRQNSLENRLRGAIERQQLLLHYQPLVDGASCRMTGVEALLRWENDEDGLMTAGQFFRTADELGLGGSFSAWALKEACMQMKKWIDRGLVNPGRDFRLTVNLSADQLSSPDLADQIGQTLKSAGLPAGCLALDIAENIVSQADERQSENLRQLRNMGIRLHLDDFSQSFGTLRLASAIPFDGLKIDPILTSVFLENPRGEAMLEALLSLAHILGMRVIAEGVENDQAFAWLRAHACDALQGHYLARPLPALEMEMLLSLPN